MPEAHHSYQLLRGEERFSNRSGVSSEQQARYDQSTNLRRRMLESWILLECFWNSSATFSFWEGYKPNRWKQTDCEPDCTAEETASRICRTFGLSRQCDSPYTDSSGIEKPPVKSSNQRHRIQRYSWHPRHLHSRGTPFLWSSDLHIRSD